MSIFEYDEELHFKTLREEGYAAGRKEGEKFGKSAGILVGREEGFLSAIIMFVQKGILSSADAAKEAGMSEEEFIKQMENAESIANSK